MPNPSQTPVIDLGRNAARQGVATSKFSVSPDEAKRIREAECQGGHQAGLVVVPQLLSERQKARTHEQKTESHGG